MKDQESLGDIGHPDIVEALELIPFYYVIAISVALRVGQVEDIEHFVGTDDADGLQNPLAVIFFV